jgi:hypothetical protein
MASWEREFLAGRCNEIQARFFQSKPVEELFDIQKDPWEVNNLANDPAYADQLAEMRKASLDLAVGMQDAGFIPETERNLRAGDTPIYDYMRGEGLPYKEILGAAVIASSKNPENVDKLKAMLHHDDSAIRYWGMQGLLMLGEDARPALPEIGNAAFDESWNVSVLGAEILYRMGNKAKALKAYHRVLDCDHMFIRTLALGSIDDIEGSPEDFLDICKLVPAKYKKPARQYDVRAFQGLLKKWEIDPASQGL